MNKNLKYIILDEIASKSPREQERLKAALTAVTRMRWPMFVKIAKSNESEGLSFSTTQLRAIAGVLRCSVHKLYAPKPYYRINDIIGDSFNPESTRANVLAALPHLHRSNIYAKMSSYVGEYNRFTIAQEKAIANVLGVPLSEIYAQHASVSVN